MRYLYQDYNNNKHIVETDNINDCIEIVKEMWEKRKTAMKEYYWDLSEELSFYEYPVKIKNDKNGIIIKCSMDSYINGQKYRNFSIQRSFTII